MGDSCYRSRYKRSLRKVLPLKTLDGVSQKIRFIQNSREADFCGISHCRAVLLRGCAAVTSNQISFPLLKEFPMSCGCLSCCFRSIPHFLSECQKLTLLQGLSFFCRRCFQPWLRNNLPLHRLMDPWAAPENLGRPICHVVCYHCKGIDSAMLCGTLSTSEYLQLVP